MSVQLLDKTRKINKLLHNNNSSKVVFNDICAVMTEILDSNVLVVSKKGKVLGTSKSVNVKEIKELLEERVGAHIDKMLNERLLSILSTKENVNLETLGFSGDVVKGYQAIITPIDIAGERLGTLFIYKQNEGYEIDDIILSEYGTAVVGLEMLRSVNEESAEETRKEHIVQSAISTLSFSELEAIVHIFDELNGTEGILVASKIADRVGITRSVIVNALRKFESAGVIESRSSGMKGTYIKVLNEVIFDELEEIKAQVAASKVTSLFDNAEEIGGVKIASAYFTGTTGDTLRGMCDSIRDKAVNPCVAVLVGKTDDKITMAVTVNKLAQEKGLKAGVLVKEISAIAGGKGGGKPDFAMAGLKDETKIDEALAAVKGIVEKQLG